MSTVIKTLYVNDFTTLIICFELSFGSLKHIEQVGGNLQIVLINIKAINISGLTNLRAKVGKNRSRLFWQSSNSTNIHGNFLRQGKNIGFLIGGEKSIQWQRNNRIYITLFENKVSQLFIVASIHNAIGDNNKSLFSRLQSTDNPLHK